MTVLLCLISAVIVEYRIEIVTYAFKFCESAVPVFIVGVRLVFDLSAECLIETLREMDDVAGKIVVWVVHFVFALDSSIGTPVLFQFD